MKTRTEEQVCWLCEGLGFYVESDATGENVRQRQCPECMIDPEPEDKL